MVVSRRTVDVCVSTKQSCILFGFGLRISCSDFNIIAYHCIGHIMDKHYKKTRVGFKLFGICRFSSFILIGFICPETLNLKQSAEMFVSDLTTVPSGLPKQVDTDAETCIQNVIKTI